ncbi:MAG: DUF1553 domain-containing protein [Planctomycetaceae bacterium]|nr:DUF1553 domain-containing protein [Planctomycetaceae bacterium]
MVSVLLIGMQTAATAEEPLHAEIDRLVNAAAGGSLAEQSTDAEFLRRISLDLAGAIPTAAKTRSFLNDTAPDKRTRLIDHLLAGDDYPRRMQQALTVMWLERRAGTTIKDAAWNKYLQASFAANKPWNEFVRELIATDGSDEAARPAIRFFVDGGRADHHQLTRDVGRLFLGMDLQCAQCHDHPSIEDYLQADYFGLYSYLKQSKLQADKQKIPFLVETVTQTRIEFQSVFTPEDKSQTGPRLPGGKEVEIPTFEKKGDEFASPAKDGLPGVPKFQPRKLLAEHLTSNENRRFARNAVNRFWFLMMGRGIVHPLDLLHRENPPSHPELLELLTDRFVAHKYDLKHLLREIALTAAYQRSSLLPDGVKATDIAPASYRVALTKPLSAEQMAWTLMTATGNLTRITDTPIPEDSKFTYKDYVNDRIPLPDNLPDVLLLFGATFGNPPGVAETEFAPSTKHSLFLMNEKLVFNWLQPREGTLMQRLSKLDNSKAVAEELYLTVLTRRPETDETDIVTEFLEQNKDRRQPALAELAWVLLSTAEFRLNH